MKDKVIGILLFTFSFLFVAVMLKEINDEQEAIHHVECRDRDTIFWEGDARNVDYRKGKWSFVDIKTNKKISTNLTCFLSSEET